MTAPVRFKQSDITRAMRGAKAAGYGRVRVGIDVAGNIVIDAANDQAPLSDERANPLDRLLSKR